MSHPSRTASLAMALLLAAILGCSKSSAPTDAPASTTSEAGKAKRTIVMIPKTTQSAFWNAVRRGGEQAAKDLDVELLWKGPGSENDRAGQKQVTQQFTNSSIDGICLAPTDSKALAAEVRSATAKGIPVLIFDSAVEGEVGKDFISFVATDNTKAGELGGKQLMELVGKGGKTICFRHMEGHESTSKREDGAIAEMKAGEAEILVDDRYTGASQGEAQTTALNMIDVVRQADGVFASNQTASEGVLKALRKTNLAGKVKFVGFDSSPELVAALRAGEIDALVVQDPVKMGYTAVKLMVDHLDGKPIEEQVVTDVRIATKENMETPEIKPLLD
ncbi:substrate-binding domain-containing protein [Lacipirellula sp.]|uniref:substrate-binding domain-containing protein n=1 Tax=Lacipirellula sp. TaxID=2691419 RepID=UPI003D106F91